MQNTGDIAAGEDFFSLLGEHTTADYSDLLTLYFRER
jgi:hypothetical protein